MLTDTDRRILQESWRQVAPMKDTLGDLFYRRLFELEPSYKAFFKGDMIAQRRKLTSMLAFMVQATGWNAGQWREDVEQERDLVMVLAALGRRHQLIYQIPASSYVTVGEALLWALDMVLGQAFDAQTRETWDRFYNLCATMMQMGVSAGEGSGDGV